MIAIYCSEKLDGIAAAAIIKRHAQLKKLPTRFGGFLHHDMLSEELEDIATNEKQLIFVLDVSITPEHLALIDKISEKNTIVYWNTHDPQSVVPKTKIFDKSTDKRCAAELVHQRFLPNDLVAQQLARLAHDVEFWQLGDERATKLTDLIMAQYNPLDLINSLAKGMYWSPHFEKEHQHYLAKKTAALDDLFKTLTIKTYLNHRFGYVTAPSILTTADACQKVLDGHAGIDVSIALYKNGKIAFRKRDDCKLDMRELAQLFDGGGNEHAAGAKLGMPVTKDTYDDVLFKLDSIFKNFFITATTLK